MEVDIIKPLSKEEATKVWQIWRNVRDTKEGIAVHREFARVNLIMSKAGMDYPIEVATSRSMKMALMKCGLWDYSFSTDAAEEYEEAIKAQELLDLTTIKE